MRLDELWSTLEIVEGLPQRPVSILRRRIESIVGRSLPRHLPYRLHRIELRGVGG